MRIRILFISLICLVAPLCTAGQLHPIDPKRESPRATLQTFIDAFNEPRLNVTPDPLDEAVNCIDLEGVPAEYRGVKGMEIAVELHEVINAVENFQVTDAPADIKGDPYHLYSSQHGEIVITRQPSGEWLFTQETVRVAPLLVADIEEQQRTHGTAILTQSDSLGSQIRERMPPVLKPRLLGFERWQWLGLGLLLALGLIAWQIARFLASIVIGRLLRGRFTYLTDEQLRKYYHPLGLLAFVVSVRLGLRALALTADSLTLLRNAMFVLTAVAVIWLAYRIVDVVIIKLRERALGTESHADDLLVPFIGAIARFGVVVIGSILVAENLDLNVTSLIAGLGIGGIAIALASQETLSNFFGSLVLLIEQPFKAEDHVEVDGVKGIVKHVGFRSTQILTFDDSLVTVPNSNIAKAKVVNDRIALRRWIVKLSVPYQNGASKIAKLAEGVEDIVRKSEYLDDAAFNINLFDMLPPALILRVEVFFKEDNFRTELAGRHQFITSVLSLADDLDVQLEVPN